MECKNNAMNASQSSHTRTECVHILNTFQGTKRQEHQTYQLLGYFVEEPSVPNDRCDFLESVCFRIHFVVFEFLYMYVWTSICFFITFFALCRQEENKQHRNTNVNYLTQWLCHCMCVCNGKNPNYSWMKLRTLSKRALITTHSVHVYRTKYHSFL